MASRPEPAPPNRSRTFSFLFVLVGVGVGLITLSSSALADRVTPNERVHSRLNVRAAPDRDADVIGHLQPDETAPFVRNLGAWREIRLGGRPAFVASGYSRIVPDPVAPPAGAAVIRIGAWNIKKLGHGTVTNFAAVASVIETNFDLLAVVEVMQRNGGHPGYDRLMTALGSGWSGQLTLTPRPRTTSGNAEFYAVIWRKALVRPCAGWTALRYHQDSDGSASATGPDVFSREPAFGCFEFGPSGTIAGDFLLAAFHATFQSGTAINAEVRQLGAVFTSMQAARPGERDLIIAGDFNRTSTQIAGLLPSFQDRTTGAGSTLNATGSITANLYDHLIVHDGAATIEMQGNAQVLDVRSVASSHAQFFRTVSDHLPIMVRMQALADDD